MAYSKLCHIYSITIFAWIPRSGSHFLKLYNDKSLTRVIVVH